MVTGGAGFVGSHVVSALAERGADVVVLDDLSTGRYEAVSKRARLVTWDIGDPATADVVAEIEPHIVVHAAAQVSVPRSMEAPDLDLRVNVVGTMHVLSGALRAGVQRLVFLSSGGAVYGDSRGARETDRPAPASYYGAHKWLAEQYVRLSGLSVAVARLSNVFGPGQRAGLEGGVVAIIANQLRDNEPITIHGDGTQRRDLIYVGDVAEALMAMVDSGASGTWNVSTGRSVAIRDLAETMMRVAGTEVPVLNGPVRAGDIRTSCLDASLIAKELGWSARWSLLEGLAVTLGTGHHGLPPGSPHASGL